MLSQNKFDIFCHAVLLGGLHRISSLALTGNNIGCAGLTALCRACARGALPNLTILYLSGNRICDPGIQAFANVYAGGVFRHLEVLYLTNNRVGDAGITAMVAAACDRDARNSKLQALNISENCVGIAGVQALIKSCESGVLQLRNIDLSQNASTITEDSIAALRLAMPRGRVFYYRLREHA